MQRTVVFLAACLAAVALAVPAAIAANGKGDGNGNQVCVLVYDNTTWATPGKLLQHVRDISGGNVIAWLSQFPGFTGNVGDWIARNCKQLA